MALKGEESCTVLKEHTGGFFFLLFFACFYLLKYKKLSTLDVTADWTVVGVGFFFRPRRFLFPQLLTLEWKINRQPLKTITAVGQSSLIDLEKKRTS